MCTPGAVGGAAVEGGGCWVPGTSDELGKQGTLVEVMELVEVRGASVGASRSDGEKGLGAWDWGLRHRAADRRGPRGVLLRGGAALPVQEGPTWPLPM